jgi:AhpD family alkylhydroperoxidase
MSSRINYQEAAPKVFQSLLALHAATRRTSLPVELLDLIDYRVSLINECAFCLDMHTKDLRARGEPEQRLYMISAWRDVPQPTRARRPCLGRSGNAPGRSARARCDL